MKTYIKRLLDTRTYFLGFIVIALVLFGAAPASSDPPSWDRIEDGDDRFEVLEDFDEEAVLDKETGLVWERRPWFNYRPYRDVHGANIQGCWNRTTGGRMGWRLPSVEELSSLVVPEEPPGTPALPLGHPFEEALSGFFPGCNGPDCATVVAFNTACVDDIPTAAEHCFFWTSTVDPVLIASGAPFVYYVTFNSTALGAGPSTGPYDLDFNLFNTWCVRGGSTQPPRVTEY